MSAMFCPMSSRRSARSSAGADDHVNLPDRLRGEPLAVPAAGGGEIGVEGFEVVEAQAAQRDVTEGGEDVAVDEPGVPVGGGGADLPSLARQPRVGEELADGDWTADLRRRHVPLGVEAVCHGVGLGAVAAGGVPSAAFLAGEGVDAVVGDDVEAVLALDDVAHRASVYDFDANPKSHLGCRCRLGDC